MKSFPEIVNRFVIAVPLFNDWAALSLLLPRLDGALATQGLDASVLVIDDGSTEAVPVEFGAGPFQALRAVDVLRLRRNLGHQRAIAVGLAYIEQHVSCDAVIVMDADGEDAPDDVPRLVEKYRSDQGATIVFAERRRRAETVIFRLLYHVYRALHHILTGHGVRVGNFSIIPRPLLSGLVVVSELWNHYAAAVFRSRQPYSTIPAARQSRLSGVSHMSFVSLVIHGLSAISVYGDRVFVRLIVFSSLLAGGALAGLLIAVGVRVLSDVPIPAWASIAVAFLALTFVQAVMFIVSLTFLGLSSRQQAPFVPARDYELYVASHWSCTSRGARAERV